MTGHNQLQPDFFHPANLAKHTFRGAALAFGLVSLWIVSILIAGATSIGASFLVPLGMATIGGSCGGVFYSFMDYLRYQAGWKKTMANVVSVMVYVVGVYLSLVLGLSMVGEWD